MLKKSTAIERFKRENERLRERRFGLPFIGARIDGEQFNPTVQEIADATDFYGYEVRDKDIVDIPDINLGGGNSMKCAPFPLSIKEMIYSLEHDEMFQYPYTEGDDNIRKVLLDYIEEEGFINIAPYNYDDIDEKGLSIHNLTFLPSTSTAFNTIINIISKPGDVILIPGPNYGLFTIRAERAGAEVEILPLSEEDNWFINPQKLADKIDEINDSLQKVYNRRKGYVPRVVAFLNINPSNPTGKVMGIKQVSLLKQIGQVCLERGVFVIDDMVYRDVTFDEKNIAKPIASIPGMFKNTITLFGLSKSHGLASLRAGFVIADELIIREVINRVFQEMDSSPDIVGRALKGAFNTSNERKEIYKEYFHNIRTTYMFRYQLLKALVEGIDSIENQDYKEQIINLLKENIKYKDVLDRVYKGLPFTKFPNNLEPEAGFFAILDFTALKGKKYLGNPILTERDLLTFFYKTSRVRFLIGQSISWPNKNELIARVTYALEEDKLIHALTLMNQSLHKIEVENSYSIRKNMLEDQRQMAHIKVDTWRDTYHGIIEQNYLDALNYEEQEAKYIESFNEYQNKVIVAVDEDTHEVLGYSCFDLKASDREYDCELLSLYIKLDNKNQGVGTTLLRETIEEMKHCNKKSMIVWCLADNKNAVEFYQKRGGIPVTTKAAKIGDDYYKEIAFKFDLEHYSI